MMTSVNGDIFCLNNVDDQTVVKADEYFESVVNEFLTASSKRNASVTARLQSCMDEIRKVYSKNLSHAPRPDWGDECYRFTYVCRFFAMHSYMVYQNLQLALADKEHLTEIWKYKPSFRVLCIGGGPGSDAVGLTKYLRDIQRVSTNRLECSIFDLRQEWENTWKMITQSNIGDDFPTMTYFSGDMTRKESGLNKGELDKVRSADVVSYVKFFSTVATFIREEATCGNLLCEIFRELKPGAMVLYIDNRYGEEYGEFKDIASSGGVTDVLYIQHTQIYMPETKQSERLTCYNKMAGNTRPFKKNTVSVMLLRKPSEDNYIGMSPSTSPTVFHPNIDISLQEVELIPPMFTTVEVEPIPSRSTPPIVTTVEEEQFPSRSPTPIVTSMEAEPIPSRSPTPIVTTVEAEPISSRSPTPIVTVVEAEPIPSRSTPPIVTTVEEEQFPSRSTTPMVTTVEAEHIPSRSPTPIVVSMKAESIPTRSPTSIVTTVEAEPIPSRSPTHIVTTVEAEPILSRSPSMEAEPILLRSPIPMVTTVETETISSRSTTPIVTWVEAEHIPSRSTPPMVATVEMETIFSSSTTPILTTDIKSDVQPQDTDEVTTALKLRCRSKSSSRYTPY